jgi:hypothetical protein
MKKLYGAIMSETRKTELIDEEIEDFDEEIQEEIIEPSIESIKDNLFESIKNALLDEDEIRLLKKFYHYAEQHTEFDFDDMGLDFNEGEDLHRRCNTLKNKIIEKLQELLELEFQETTIDTLHMVIITHTTYKEQTFKIVIEVFEDSFDLELI